MSERFVCVLTWRYISTVYILSLCAVLRHRLLHCMLSLRFVDGLRKTLFVLLFVCWELTALPRPLAGFRGRDPGLEMEKEGGKG